MQVTFMSENKLQKENFLAKYDFGDLCIHLEPLLRWQYAYMCHGKRIKKEGSPDK